MIQDILPYVLKNTYLPKPPTPDSTVLIFQGKEVLLTGSEDNIRFPRFSELVDICPRIYSEYTYLFSIDDQRFYLVGEIDYDKLVKFRMVGTQIFRTARPKHLAFAGITGFQLYNWYINHHYCGRCGNLLKQDEIERMMFCETCHNMEYPKISPAIIVGVTHGNRILLSKYANREYKRYALLAGFAEIGETIEETVHREVMEEVGLKVKNIRYYKSQPWSFTDTLLLGFFADLDGEEAIKIDQAELALAEWFDRDKIPPVESMISLTSEMIEAFRAKKV